jgi:hypothetical protein
MTSDSGMEEDQGPMGEEEMQMGEMQGSMEAPVEEETSAAMEAPSSIEEEAGAATAAPKKKVSGRRAALKIVRENVERVSKDLGTFRKSSESSTKRLEKQLAQLRSDISALKSHVAKEATRAREKQESLSNKILQRLTAAQKLVKRTSPKKVSSSPKRRRNKGKK